MPAPDLFLLWNSQLSVFQSTVSNQGHSIEHTATLYIITIIMNSFYRGLLYLEKR